MAEAGYTRGALYKHFVARRACRWRSPKHAPRNTCATSRIVSTARPIVTGSSPGGPAFGEGERRWSVATYEFAAWIAGQPELAATVVADQRLREGRIVEMLARNCARLGIQPVMPLPQVVVLIGALGGSLALRRAVDPATDVRAVAAGVLAAVFPMPAEKGRS